MHVYCSRGPKSRMVTGVTVVINLKLSNSSCGHLEVRNTQDTNGDCILHTVNLALESWHAPVAQGVISTLQLVLPSLVRNNVQPVNVPFLVLAGLKDDREGAGITLHVVQGALHVLESFGDGFEFSILRARGFDNFEQAAAAYIHTLVYGAMQAEKAASTNHQHPSAMLCSHMHKLDGWQIADCRLMAIPI